MKIVENKNNEMVAFANIGYGDIFRYDDEIAMKVPANKTRGGTIRAINMSTGRAYIFIFDDENILVEPLDATLVIN